MLQVEYLPLADLLPYARNARTHSEAQIAQIAGSIKEFGWTNPILVSDSNDIIAGHGRCLAAAKLKMDKVPCIRLSKLTDSQRKAYILADNRIALNGGWDDAMLKLELQELQGLEVDLSSLGFDTVDLDRLLQPATDTDPWEGDGDESAPSEVPPDSQGQLERILLVYNQADYKKVTALSEEAMASMEGVTNMSELFMSLLEQYADIIGKA